jgi:hypothetical protein
MIRAMAVAYASFCILFAVSGNQKARADDSCSLKQVGEIPIKFDPQTGRPLVTITAGGQPLTLVIDTEAPFSTITAEAAARLNGKMHPTDKLNFGMRAGGKDIISYANIKNIEIGRIQMTSSDFPVLPVGPPARNDDGDLGLDILQNFDVEFDFLNGSMKLFAHYDCSKPPIYWSDSYGDMDLISNPFHYIIFHAALDGKEVPTILGTAYRLTAMPRKIASDRFNIRPNASEGACSKDAQSGDKFALLEIGGLSIRNPEINSDCNHPLCPTAETTAPELGIGVNHLKKLRVFLAWKQRKIYFTPATLAN